MSTPALTRRLPALGQFNKGDWDGFLGLSTRILAMFVLCPSLLIGTIHLAPALVFGQVIPGLALSLMLGTEAFVYYATRLAAAEQRSDVTALPYGISTPVMFVYLFGIMWPVYASTQDPLQAYRIGLGAVFVGGVVDMSAAFVGPWLQRITPGVGLIGTIAGIALVWLGVIPLALIFGNPLIGLPSLFIVLLGVLGAYNFPFRLPVGVIVMGLGISLGLLTGDARISLEGVSVSVPLPVVGDLWLGLRLLLAHPEFLVIIIAMEISSSIETIGNVESAMTVGDNYSVRTSLLTQGAGSCLGAIFGAPFPTVVWIGHPVYKQMKSGVGYALLTGIFIFVVGILGLFAFLYHLVPVASIATLLAIVGILMVRHAFQSTPPAYGAAIALAMTPHIADLLKKQLDGALLETLSGAVTPELLTHLAENHSVYLQSYGLLSQGAVIIGLLWGSMTAFVMEGRLRQAALFSGLAGLLSLVGLIHAERVGLSFSPVVGGYLLLAVLFGFLDLIRREGKNDI